MKVKGSAPAVRDLLRPGAPTQVAAVADISCGQHDRDAQFVLGLDLMLDGIEDTNEFALRNQSVKTDRGERIASEGSAP